MHPGLQYYLHSEHLGPEQSAVITSGQLRQPAGSDALVCQYWKHPPNPGQQLIVYVPVTTHVAPAHGSKCGGKNGGKYGGKYGGATGVTEFDADETVLTPYPDIVVTVNVYAVPLLNPLTVIGELEPLPVSPPGLDVAT